MLKILLWWHWRHWHCHLPRGRLVHLYCEVRVPGKSITLCNKPFNRFVLKTTFLEVFFLWPPLTIIKFYRKYSFSKSFNMNNDNASMISVEYLNYHLINIKWFLSGMGETWRRPAASQAHSVLGRYFKSKFWI